MARRAGPGTRPGGRPGRGSVEAGTFSARSLDHPSLAAFDALAVWTGLVVLIFTPFPVWIGHWAYALQQRADSIAPRVPARGAMVAAVVAAWAVLTVGLYLLLDNFILVSGSSAAADWQALPGSLRGTALVIAIAACSLGGVPAGGGDAAGGGGGAPPMAGHVMRATRPRGAGELGGHGPAGPGRVPDRDRADDGGGQRGRARAYRRSRRGEALDLLIGLSFFDEQVIVVIAVVCAVIGGIPGKIRGGCRALGRGRGWGGGGQRSGPARGAEHG